VDAATTIVNAKVFDGRSRGDWLGPVRGRPETECSAVPAAQEGDEVNRTRRRTVLPGLIDAHVPTGPGDLVAIVTLQEYHRFSTCSATDLVARAKEQAWLPSDRADVRFSGVGDNEPAGTVDDVRPVPDVDR